MSAPKDKPDRARADQFLRNLVADAETQRYEALADDAYDAEAKESGRDYARVPGPDQLVARLRAKAPPQAEGKRRVVWAIAAAVAVLLGALTFAKGREILALFVEPPAPIRPDIEQSPRPPDPRRRAKAEEMRDDAAASCSQGFLVPCESLLDDAKKLDPAGEDEPRVQEMRRQINGEPPAQQEKEKTH
jgi:hypothetical protein